MRSCVEWKGDGITWELAAGGSHVGDVSWAAWPDHGVYSHLEASAPSEYGSIRKGWW